MMTRKTISAFLDLVVASSAISRCASLTLVQADSATPHNITGPNISLVGKHIVYCLQNHTLPFLRNVLRCILEHHEIILRFCIANLTKTLMEFERSVTRLQGSECSLLHVVVLIWSVYRTCHGQQKPTSIHKLQLWFLQVVDYKRQ